MTLPMDDLMQPEALRLAGRLESLTDESSVVVRADAAAELRRLHEVSTAQEALVEELFEQCRINGMGAERELALMARIAALETANAELLEALVTVADVLDECSFWVEVDKARAAIAKHGGRA